MKSWNKGSEASNRPIGFAPAIERLEERLTPAFAAPVTNPFGLSNTGATAAPAFGDLDNDGLRDAIIGLGNGDFSYFHNTGTASAPNFASPQTNPFGLTNIGTPYATPVLVDIDADGDLDLISGSYTGDFLYYQNTGTASAPAFAASVMNPFGLTPIGSYATVTLTDINHDGALDAFASDLSGNVSYFQNTGTASSPAFAAVQTNPFGLTNTGGSASAAFTDIDYDGKLDAFVATGNGDIKYFHNTGSLTAPSFAAPVTNPFGTTNAGTFPRITFADINGDNAPDLFSSTLTPVPGDLYYFENLSLPPPVTLVDGTLTIPIVGMTATLTQLSRDSVNVKIDGVDQGNFIGVRHIVVQGGPSDDVLILANIVDIPTDFHGGAGTDTFDASAVAKYIVTYIGPDNLQPSSFDDVEILDVGYTIFLPGAEFTGTINANGNLIDFSRLGFPIDANLDSPGVNVNGALNARNIGLAIGPLFMNNKIAPSYRNATNFLGRNLTPPPTSNSLV